VHSLFQNGAPVASGIDAGLKILGRRGDTNILVIAGDGSTVDIGLGALSATAERRHKIIYLCYDNESYMNTGGQRSGGTPFGSATTTSPVGKLIKGEQRPQEYARDVAEILIAQGCDYVAKTSIAYPLDIIKKFETASKNDGMSFITIHTPCPTGWGFDQSKTIEVARMAVKSGFTVMLEYKNGKRTLQKVPAKKVPIKEYLKLQRRYSHFLDDDELVSQLQKAVDDKLDRLKRDCLD
jgi:pyruvate ferredoxin oxidoreductase beta subunit